MSPKRFVRNDANLNVLLPSDLKRKIRALSWVWGNDGGRISHTVRRMLAYFVDSLLKQWKEEEPDKFTEYEAVLENLYKAEKLKELELAEKLELKELEE